MTVIKSSALFNNITETLRDGNVNIILSTCATKIGNFIFFIVFAFYRHVVALRFPESSCEFLHLSSEDTNI